MNPKRVFLATLLIALLLFTIVEGRGKTKTPSVSANATATTTVETVVATPTSTSFPYVCNISNTAKDTYVCGGVLVASDFVATSAHCVDSINVSKKRERLTVYCDDASFTASVSEIILHEKWRKVPRLSYDIALLRLDTPSKLPTANFTATELSLENGTLLSFDWIKQKGGYYETSEERTEVSYIDSKVCSGRSHWTRSIDGSVFCTLPTGRDDCSSESGAALFLVPNKTENYSEPYVLVGISAFGSKECDVHGFPVIYTSISQYADWLNEKILGVEPVLEPGTVVALVGEQFRRNITDIYGDSNTTELIEAALIVITQDDARTLEVFIDIGLDVDAKYDEFDRSLLHYAADKDAFESAQVLIAAGANHSAVSVFGTTPVHAAASSGSVSVAKVLLEAGSYVNAVDESYTTPLHHLLSDGNGTLIQLLYLLEAGANVHEEDSFDVTPLHLASRDNWISATKVLLKAGANLIIYAGDDGAPVHYAAAAGANDTLEILIDAGTDLEARPFTGLRETALSYAVRNDGPLSTIQILLDSGANPDVKDLEGYTPLHRAAQRGAIDIIAALIKAGASVTTTNQDGDYPRDIFCKKVECSSSKNRRTYKILKYN